MGARLYNPRTGRFLQVDPVYRGGANAYVYCSADPVNCVDLDGKGDCKRVVFVTICGKVMNIGAAKVRIAKNRCGKVTVCGTNPKAWLYFGQISTRYWKDTDAFRAYGVWMPVYDGMTVKVSVWCGGPPAREWRHPRSTVGQELGGTRPLPWPRSRARIGDRAGRRACDGAVRQPSVAGPDRPSTVGHGLGREGAHARSPSSPETLSRSRTSPAPCAASSGYRPAPASPARAHGRRTGAGSGWRPEPLLRWRGVSVSLAAAPGGPGHRRGDRPTGAAGAARPGRDAAARLDAGRRAGRGRATTPTPGLPPWTSARTPASSAVPASGSPPTTGFARSMSLPSSAPRRRVLIATYADQTQSIDVADHVLASGTTRAGYPPTGLGPT